MDVVDFEPVGQRVSVLAAAVFAASLYKWMEHAKDGQAVFHPIIALAIVLSLASVVHTALDWLLCKLPMRFRFSRRLLSATASIEGYWFQNVHDLANPYSIVCIEFDSVTNSYKYHGTNYKPDGHRNAYFDSVQTDIHASGRALTFNFVAAVHRWSPHRKTVDTNAARGYGRVTFMTETSKQFILGRGEFFETNPKPNWRIFDMYKIPDATVHKALGEHRNAIDDMDYDTLFMYAILDREAKDDRLNQLLAQSKTLREARELPVLKQPEVLPEH